MSDFIENYLKRFRGALDESNSQKDGVIAVMRKNIRVNLDRSDVEIKEGILFLKAKPIVRSEIMMKKEKLLAELKKLKIFEIK